MKSRIMAGLLLALILLPQAAQAARDNREDILAAMTEFLTVPWESATESACLESNLLHENYDVQLCDGTSDSEHHCSDFLWHPDYLDDDMGTPLPFSAMGMPYLYGGNTYPFNLAAEALDCRALGAHYCHYKGNHRNVSWATGTDCSAAVSYALEVERVATGSLDTDDFGTVIEWDELQMSSYVVKSGSHVVLVEDNAAGTLTILEATGAYPVSRRKVTPDTYYLTAGYTPRDPAGLEDPVTAVGDPVVPIARITLSASPNPFNPLVTIRFSQSRSGHTALRIFDVSGRLVTNLVDEWRQAGEHETSWEGRNERGRMCPAGVYLCRLTVDGEGRTLRVVMVR